MPQVADFSIPAIDISSTNGVVLPLYSPHASGQSYDLSSAWTVDSNLTVLTGTAVGILYIYLQNDNPLTSPFVTDAVLQFAVAANTFADSQTKQTVSNDTLKICKYAYFFWKKDVSSTGTGTIALDGFKSLV